MKRWSNTGFALSAFVVVLTAAATSSAQTIDDIKRAKAQVGLEPSVTDTVRTALKYFRVNPEAVESLRSTARARGVLPLLAAGYRYDNNAMGQLQRQVGTSTFDNTNNTDTTINSFSIGAVWDLRELMMNPAEIQAYGLVGVQRDIMLEVSRVYYLRRQVVLKLLLRPSEDPLGNLTNEVRVEEMTAILDVLTDGWFSRESARRARLAKKRGLMSSLPSSQSHESDAVPVSNKQTTRPRR